MVDFTKENKRLIVVWFLRLSISASFLSAVADRFGIWGVPGSPGVAWGSFSHFVNYTHVLLPFLSDSLNYFAAVFATILEIVLPLLLLFCIKTPLVAKCSAFLLLLFAFGMIIAGGIKAPLDYSVFSAAAGSFALSFIASKE